MINVMLTQILEQDARARRKCMYLTHTAVLSLSILTVNSIGLVRPEKAQTIERMLIRMAQMGQIQGKVNIIIVSKVAHLYIYS